MLLPKLQVSAPPTLATGYIDSSIPTTVSVKPGMLLGSIGALLSISVSYMFASISYIIIGEGGGAV